MSKFRDNKHALDYLREIIGGGLRFEQAALMMEYDYPMPCSANAIKRRERRIEAFVKLSADFAFVEKQFRDLGLC